MAPNKKNCTNLPAMFTEDLFDGEDIDEETYEERRRKNIKENQAMLTKLMAEIKDMPGLPDLPMFRQSPITKKPVKPIKPKRSLDIDRASPLRRNPSRHARYSPSKDSPTRGTRLSARLQRKREEEEDEVFPVMPGQDELPLEEDNTIGDDESHSDEEYHLPTPTKRRRGPSHNAPRPPDDITDEELKMVADSVKDKKYDSVYGSTCHQCRQKTNDMKTICRSVTCTGVRGQFCGPCLRNRYGEDAREALLDENWICPPCRGNCNCSFCRKKQGRHATGILIHVAKHHGYRSVKDFLESFGRK